MIIYTAKLTKVGLALYTSAITAGVPVQLTAMAVGDGNGQPTTPSASQTALVGEKYRSALGSLKVDENDSSLIFAELVIPPNVGGWAIREVGLFTADGVLFAVSNFPDTYKPLVADGASRDLVLQFALKLDNAAAVQLVIDATIVTATRQWVLSTITPAVLLPGGTTHQVLRKKTNADGDLEWADPTESVNLTIDAVKEIQISAAGQQTFTLAVCSTQGVAVYIEGSREHHYTILNSTQVQLAAPIPQAGIEVMFVQNEPGEPINFRAFALASSYFMGQL